MILGRAGTARAVAAVALAVPLLVGPGGRVAAATIPLGVTAQVVTDSSGQGLPEPEPRPPDVRSVADDVLDDPKFDEPPKSVVQRVMEWIGEQLARLLNTFSGGTGGGFAWVIVALLVGALVFFATRMRGSFRRRPRVGDDPLFVTEVEARRTPLDWIVEAERLEAAQDWKGALRCRYRAVLGQLIERGVVRDIPGRTSGEFRFEVRRTDADLSPAFDAVSDLFDSAWYGDEPTGRDENRRFRALAEQFETGGRVRAAASMPMEAPT